jgi:hypothetical protein
MYALMMSGGGCCLIVITNYMSRRPSAAEQAGRCKAAALTGILSEKADKVCCRVISAEGMKSKNPAPALSPFAPETGFLTNSGNPDVPPKPEPLPFDQRVQSSG